MARLSDANCGIFDLKMAKDKIGNKSSAPRLPGVIIDAEDDDDDAARDSDEAALARLMSSTQ